MISLGVDQTIKNILQFIKGESSFWINKNQLTKEKLEKIAEVLGVTVEAIENFSEESVFNFFNNFYDNILSQKPIILPFCYIFNILHVLSYRLKNNSFLG